MRKGSAKNVVEINGRLYDAHTGLPASTPITKDPTKTKVIDGFVANKKRPQAAATKTRKAAPKAHSVHAKAKKATTLNRASLKKPKLKQKHHSAPKVATKSLGVPHRRTKAAETTAKSPHVARYSPAVPKPPSPAAHHQAAPPKPVSTKTSVIEDGLKKATAHEVKKSKSVKQKLSDNAKRRPRAFSMAASALAIMLLAGYVTYLNAPNLALRVAAREAGFEAKLPGYEPNGYSLSGPISYEQGRITVRFNSNDADRAYAITQRETNWDSQSLLDNHVSSSASLYQTYQERGLTIYVFNGSEATWVNGGIWYSIEGDSRLNAEQLIKIASSL